MIAAVFQSASNRVVRGTFVCFPIDSHYGTIPQVALRTFPVKVQAAGESRGLTPPPLAVQVWFLGTNPSILMRKIER